MMTAEQYVGQPIRSLQTMLRTIAHADETLVRLVPDGIYGPNTVQAVREFQFALRPWPKRELRLCVRPERAACLASFLSGELKLSVSTPPEHAFLTQPPAGAVLLGSGILCRLYPQHPSLCLDTPVLHQQLFSTHLPFAGIRGTANLLSALYPLLTEDV